MSWADIKRGDVVLVVDLLGEDRERVYRDCEVLSVGRTWITVQFGASRTKFDAETGCGEYGLSVHTEESYQGSAERLDLIRKIRPTLWNSVSLEKLRRIAAILEEG